uniref:Uncharacterized protein n=1 Tax=Arundo donax TaxID=35708 RepID=A0A0A9DD29_ARUDO
MDPNPQSNHSGPRFNGSLVQPIELPVHNYLMTLCFIHKTQVGLVLRNLGGTHLVVGLKPTICNFYFHYATHGAVLL